MKKARRIPIRAIPTIQIKSSVSTRYCQSAFFIIFSFLYKRFINFGMDYTFGIGNGIRVMGEYFNFVNSEKITGSGNDFSFSAFSASYPLGFFDNITMMVYYDWGNKEWYRFVNWQRTFDKWSFYIMGFWNPEQFQIYQNLEGNNLFTGIGFQLMAVFNH